MSTDPKVAITEPEVEEAEVRLEEDVEAPLPPAFVAGLAEAGQEVVWAFLYEHAPRVITDILWRASQFDQYARDADVHGGRVAAELAREVTRDLPAYLLQLEAQGCNLRLVSMIGPDGVA